MSNTNTPMISIITVCLNSEGTIEQTLKSVVNQSYQNYEHIIIDGESSDDTLSIIKKYPHIKKIISEKDYGIYDAMNKGIESSSGDIVGFLNSDDFYNTNNTLERIASCFTSGAYIDACYSDLVYTDRKDTSRITRYWKSSAFIKGSFSKGWNPPHPTFYARRSLYNKYNNFDLDYDIASDIELMIRFLEVYNIKTIYVPEVWIKMRRGGISNDNIRNRVIVNYEILQALRKWKLKYNTLSFMLHKLASRIRQVLF